MRLVIAIVIVLILILVVKDKWVLIAFLGGFILAAYLTPDTLKSITGGDCDDFRAVYKETPEGYRSEAMLVSMLNCYVSKGKFIPVEYGQPGAPHWLYRLNARGRRVGLSLDGYNEEANVAFEYNGPRHYSRYDDTTWEKYQQYTENDSVKRMQMRRNGVKFILVHHGIDMADWPRYLKSRLQDLGLLHESFHRFFRYMPVVPEPEVDMDPFRVIHIRQAPDGKWIQEVRYERPPQ